MKRTRPRRNPGPPKQRPYAGGGRDLEDYYKRRDDRDGYCWCGCGQPTGRVKENEPERGYRAGDHYAFVHGHQQRVAKNRKPTRVQTALRDRMPEERPLYVDEQKWQTLVLHVNGGLSYERIAETVGGSSMRHKHRARRATKLILEGGPAPQQKAPYRPGDPIHGRVGVLATDSQKAECHVCGKWYTHLGNHVKRTHGMEADEYKKEFGLKATTGLISPELAEKRRDTSHLRPYDEHHSEQMRAWSAERRREHATGREVRAEQRLDPEWQQTVSRSLEAAREGLRRKREAGEYVEGPGPPAWAGENGRAKFARLLEAPAFRERVGRKISEARGGVKTETRRCAVCEEPFEHVAYVDRLTCSEKCSRELRARQIRERAPSKRPEVRQKISEAARKPSKDRPRDQKGRFI